MAEVWAAFFSVRVGCSLSSWTLHGRCRASCTIACVLAGYLLRQSRRREVGGDGQDRFSRRGCAVRPGNMSQNEHRSHQRYLKRTFFATRS